MGMTLIEVLQQTIDIIEDLELIKEFEEKE